MGKIDRVVASDVLVIGGAGAGVMSAVRAAQSGVSVALVSKGRVGKSGNTIMIGGGFSIDGHSARRFCDEADANQGYTPEDVFEKLVTSGFFLGDQQLQRVFAQVSGPAVRECLDWAKEAKQLFLFNPGSCSWRTSGAAFGRTVSRGLQEYSQISVFEDVLIAELLTSGGRVCGALGIDLYSGELIQYNAGAVILATGGFQPFSVKNSNSDMTGDGIALALRAGARAVDMEFLLFIGTILEPAYAKGSLLPFLMTIPAIFRLKAKVTDLDGRELEFPSDPRYKVGPTSGKVNKLLMSEFYGRGVFEKFDRHGGAFYYDYSAYSGDEIREAFRALADGHEKWHRKGYYNGIDLFQLAEDIIQNGKRMKVTLGNEYSMGGVVVNPDFSTDVEGLYAAGEVTGGTFGAFRSGDGLTEMLAHGYVAGVSAARYAEAHERLRPEDAEEKAALLLAPLGRREGLSPIEARIQLERICDEGFNFFRDGNRLERAYEQITALRRSLDGLSVPDGRRAYNLEWMNTVIVRNLSLCAELGIYAALHRKESRGTHLRADYPQVNNAEYLFNFVSSLKDGEAVYEKSTPIPHELPLPVQNYSSVSDFIAQRVLAKESGV